LVKDEKQASAWLLSTARAKLVSGLGNDGRGEQWSGAPTDSKKNVLRQDLAFATDKDAGALDYVS
jgi:hypothetical protein